ncbi:hypothetical protein ACTPGW_002601 [Enterococcus faecalis]
MKKSEYILKIKEMLLDDEYMRQGNSDEEIIFLIDDLAVYGGFDMGIRGTDHNTLLFEGVEWEDILSWGVVAIPESKTYVSDEKVRRFEQLGYKRIPISEY